jgi:hypothetical protein
MARRCETMRRLAAFLMLPILVLTACNNSPTPDIEATVQAAVAAALTALPTDTSTPKPTHTPVSTATSTPDTEATVANAHANSYAAATYSYPGAVADANR